MRLNVRATITWMLAVVGGAACADDAVAPRAVPDVGVNLQGMAGGQLPGTLNATLELLGAPAGATGTTVPLGINASGVTVGYTFIGSTQYGVVFDPAAIVTPPISPPGPNYVQSLTAINDAGVASGRVNGEAALYTVTGPTAGNVQGLPSMPGSGPYSQIAWDINNHGDAVGILSPTFGALPVTSALWPVGGGVVDLGISNVNGATAVAPNLTGPQLLVVGSDNPGGPRVGWMWSVGTKTPLIMGTPEDVADNGWIVGGSDLLRGGVITDLSIACAADVGQPSTSSMARAISFVGARAVIVGECDGAPYVWYEVAQGDFEGEFLPLFPGDLGGAANDVNASGQIVGYSGDGLTGHSLRWTFTLPPLNTAPTANAGGPYTGGEGSNVAFSGSGSSDPENNPLTYAWDFGDGSTGTGVSPTHAYADNGAYTVSLTVSDGSLTHSTSTTATITNVAPTGVPSAPTTIGAGVPFAISLAGADAGSVDATSLQYRFNCGSTWTALSPTPSTTCTIATAGTYTLRFRVRDKDLANTTYQQNITVTTANAKPVVTITSPTNVTIPVGGSVTITGSFTDSVGDNPWAGLMFWGAGQGSTNLGSVTPGQVLSATRTYLVPGVYGARLEVKDKFNANGKANVTITVQ